ncbi:a disintegrin and metalloproteinase with thrombospondin motifs 20 [Trichonephila inaurata madagascariensis]|uniref:A disintegrin and metalloproteinase with thrombospondin motifs 20 n=1 Tax=Trichonephila inaurata madagascariensis TaxID=2747483 RepID=A0A8X6XZ60_9ARAC|nr:a disintegrin and metalloproteinase with thrombospondin motifs 20 [Trichonephila inaurata madagascariensis]
MWTLVILTACLSTPLLAHKSPDISPDDNHRISVYPIRIDIHGQPYPHHLQFRRKGQATWHGKTRYKFQGYNRTWIIELQPYHHQHLKLNLTKFEARAIVQSGCYYKGRVRGETISSVKVSLCEGMTGDIHLSHGDYVIYPFSYNESSFQQHHLSLLQHLDPDRPWRPLLTEDIHFCDVKDELMDHEKQETLLNRDETSISNSSRPLIRKRRSESRELHLEVLVVADSQMANYHGPNLDHYILTLMSTVALIYKDPSIGNHINIAVVDIVVLNETADREIIHHIAPITLRKFCRWQHKHNSIDDRDPKHYDTAILITREDLCRFPGACDTLGLAQSGMVCDSESSCAIVEDNGLSAAFTIAHELGHVMSIPHDDDSKCSRFHSQKKKLHVMARMLDYNSHPWSWSECSRQYLTTFFDVGYGRCLMDKPGRNRLLLNDEFHQPPGQLYPRDAQCELVFGPKSRICPYMPECKRLWCTMDGDSTQGGCRTQHMPWADGTQCGESKRCYQGECIRYRPAGLTPIDGQWGRWQPFGTCSRTCGGGIQQAFRECDSPKPSNGGRYCTGIRVKYKSCNTEDCSPGSQDFRAKQCSEFNGKDINLPGVPHWSSKWIPQYSGIPAHEKCKLYCKINDSSSYFVLREKVVDGTPCDLGSFDICVNGKCEIAGCDHILHSKVSLDRCGVCGGSNDTCKEIKGHFNKRVDYGYHNVVMIPPGASNLRVVQESPDGNVDDNYIALKDPADKYILNGDFMISMFPKTLSFHGTTIDYSGSHSVIEHINCSETLTKDLFVQVLVVGKLQPPNISFSYTVPLSGTQLYTWKLATQYSECTRLCNGISSLKPICVRLSDQYPVNDNHCNDLSKPSLQKTRKCNEHCNLKWKDVSKLDCSAQCRRGMRHRIIKCMKEETSSKIAHAVPEEHCKHLGPKPSSTEKCPGSCLNSSWIYSDWSECSVSCGVGTQQRTYECRSAGNVKQLDEQCDPSTKVVSKVCDQGPCPRWMVGNWTEMYMLVNLAIRRFIDNEKLEAFTYQLNDEKELKAVIQGMPSDTPPQEIIEDLRTFGISVNECHAMTNRRTGLSMPLFLITLPRTEVNRNVFNLTELCYLKIKGGTIASQIRTGTNAKDARVSFIRPNSARGTQSALNAVCPTFLRTVKKSSDTEATCCNCQGNHTANFTGCPRNPLNKPPPPPKVNFWEERAKKRMELQEAAKAKAEAARPATIPSVSARDPTPPPVRTVPTRTLNLPPVRAAPTRTPTPPPVSTAPTPWTRPAPTPSAHQPLTSNINTNSTPLRPSASLHQSSSIMETLHQLRDPKVVEIFQVLRQIIAITHSDKPLADRAFEVAALLQIDLAI